MGDKPEGLDLDRVDNERGYEPGNCRWTTRTENNRNQGLHTTGDDMLSDEEIDELHKRREPLRQDLLRARELIMSVTKELRKGHRRCGCGCPRCEHQVYKYPVEAGVWNRIKKIPDQLLKAAGAPWKAE